MTPNPTPSDDPDVVVVTGANEGIGHHLLRTLVEDGYRVGALDVAVGNLRELEASAPDRTSVHECDVTEDEEVERAFADVIDRWGRIDVLVNNAGIFEFGLVDERTMVDTRREFEVNYFGYLRTIHAVLPHMRARNSGTIHNVSSGVGLLGHPGLSGYVSTKAAIDGLTRSLRLELQDEDVSCTVMYPALASTRSGVRLGYPESSYEDPADVGRRLARRIHDDGPVIYSDWRTRLFLTLARRVPYVGPSLVKRGTRRFLDPDAVPAETESS